MHVNERFKNKNQTKSRHIQIDDLTHKKCNGIIKGWHHCLTSELKGRFLVNNHSSEPHPHPPPALLFKRGEYLKKNHFFCHHNFIKKSHSMLSKNEPENIP